MAWLYSQRINGFFGLFPGLISLKHLLSNRIHFSRRKVAGILLKILQDGGFRRHHNLNHQNSLPCRGSASASPSSS